ncbi:MAG: tetratricopeptide repeat protein [Thermodesulfobacteriota bacterium]
MSRVAFSLLCFFLFSCWAWSGALAQIEIDLGPQEVPTLEAEEPEAILGVVAKHMDRGEAAMALATIAQGLARHPGDPRLLERRADIYATLPFLRSQAAEIYKRLLAQRPTDLAVKIKLANLYLALRRIAQAERLFQEVLAADPDNPEAHLGLGRLYLKSAFFTLAREHFAQAYARLPENREALSGLEQTRGLVTPQIHTLTNFFEDSEGFRRFSLWSGFRAYVNPRIRLYSGYGYLTYNSGPGPFRRNQAGQSLHRHVLPLILQYRPVRTVLAELGVAGNDYGRWGQSVTTRAAAYWQATAGTGLSLSYSYYDFIDFFGPFRGPWGLYFDDFTGYGRYRYQVVNPIGLWAQNYFGAVFANTLAVTQKIRAQDVSLWGYQALGPRLILSGFGDWSFITDGNLRRIMGGMVQYRVLWDPLLKIKYSLYYGDFQNRAIDLAQPGAGPPYADFHSLKYHAWGVVLEYNWSDRAKFIVESNVTYNQVGNGPGENVLVELNYLLTSHLSMRAVGFYANSMLRGGVSYQARSVSGGLSYRF